MAYTKMLHYILTHYRTQHFKECATIQHKSFQSYMDLHACFFWGRVSFLTKPARIREETLDMATSSAAVELRLPTAISNQSTTRTFAFPKSLTSVLDAR